MSLAAGTFATLSTSANFFLNYHILPAGPQQTTALRCRVQKHAQDSIRMLYSTGPTLGWHPAGEVHADSIQNLCVAITSLPGGLQKPLF